MRISHLRTKATSEVRARIVATGCAEVINSIYASTPMFCVLRILLTVALALARSWVAATGDIATAVLHATAATTSNR